MKTAKFTQDVVRNTIEKPWAALLDFQACLFPYHPNQETKRMHQVQLGSGSDDLWQNAQGSFVFTKVIETFLPLTH